MAHDDCPTCTALAASTVEVIVEPTEDETVRIFRSNAALHPGEPITLDTPSSARSIPLARALWASGVLRIVLHPHHVEVWKKPAARWEHLEPTLTRILHERLTLGQASTTS